jgi:hypothetical protein
MRKGRMKAPDPRWRAAMTVPVIASVAFFCTQTTQVDAKLVNGFAELRVDIVAQTRAVIAQVEWQRPYSCRLYDDGRLGRDPGFFFLGPTNDEVRIDVTQRFTRACYLDRQWAVCR